MVKVLFMIDDDQGDCDIFREAVAMCSPHIEVIFAQDGVEALEILASSAVLPDAIFLDYNMPRMTGVECLKRLKADKVTQNIPTIVYSTSGDRELENVVLLLGADHHMQKTVKFNDLCNELARLFDLIDQRVSLKTLRLNRTRTE